MTFPLFLSLLIDLMNYDYDFFYAENLLHALQELYCGSIKLYACL